MTATLRICWIKNCFQIVEQPTSRLRVISTEYPILFDKTIRVTSSYSPACYVEPSSIDIFLRGFDKRYDTDWVEVPAQYVKEIDGAMMFFAHEQGWQYISNLHERVTL